MNRIFESKEYFPIPDGTLLAPFLNPKDMNCNLPFELIEGFSLANGIIKKKTQSKIHLLPHVDQVTYVLSGNIKIIMKGDKDGEPYTLTLGANFRLSICS